MFKFLFPNSTKATLYTTKNNSVILKAYSQSDIEQPDMCTVKLGHKDNSTKCRFFIIPGKG